MTQPTPTYVTTFTCHSYEDQPDPVSSILYAGPSYASARMARRHKPKNSTVIITTWSSGGVQYEREEFDDDDDTISHHTQTG